MMPSNMSVQNDLDLTEDQRTALTLLEHAAKGMSTLGASIRALMSSQLAVTATAAMSGMQCPYANPPEAIVGDFDANRNMYLHCLHPTKHCWSMAGQATMCP